MSQIVLDVLIVAASVLLAASAVMALYRIVRGPSILDRMIATDVVLASIMCGLGGYMALSGRTDLLPVLIVLAMLGFVGSVSVSRYVSKSDSMTPGAEAGALSDFSASDWHMPKSSDDAGSGAGAGSSANSGAATDSDAWPDDVARGIANVADGPEAVTVRDEEPVVGLDSGSDPEPADAHEVEPADADEAELGTESEAVAAHPAGEDSAPKREEEPFDEHADVDGEGLGTGPDPGPADADDGPEDPDENDDDRDDDPDDRDDPDEGRGAP
ncbi:MAG: monovalent cation/H+ antiporter complex subunit F [Brevibacterium sp.]